MVEGGCAALAWGLPESSTPSLDASHDNVLTLAPFARNLVRGHLRTCACSMTIYTYILRSNRVFVESLIGLGFLPSVSCIKPIPTHEKLFAVGKKWPQMPLLTYFFLGWVGLGLGSSSVS